MAHTFTFQGSHSRNTHDWTLTTLQGGRRAFVANENGVNQRIGALVSYLADNPGSTMEEMGAYLRGSVHASYRVTDVSQPIRQMLGGGMVTKKGAGKSATYTLTANAKRIYRNAQRKWI